jgi:hypothetical protein
LEPAIRRLAIPGVAVRREKMRETAIREAADFRAAIRRQAALDVST